MRFVIVGGFGIEVDGGTELGMWRAEMLDGLLWFWRGRGRDWVLLFRYCCAFVHVMKKATVPVQKCPATVFRTLFILFKINRVIAKSHLRPQVMKKSSSSLSSRQSHCPQHPCHTVIPSLSSADIHQPHRSPATPPCSTLTRSRLEFLLPLTADRTGC